MVATLATVFGKKKLTADDLIKPPEQQKSALIPKTEAELQDKISRILGSLN